MADGLSTDVLRTRGNDKYKAADYVGAVEDYTAAIAGDPTNVTIFTNRAAAFLMLEKYEEALSDARTAMSLQPSFVKAYSRGAKACLRMVRRVRRPTLVGRGRRGSGLGPRGPSTRRALNPPHSSRPAAPTARRPGTCVRPATLPPLSPLRWAVPEAWGRSPSRGARG